MTERTARTPRADENTGMVRVWDPFVRTFHWTVVVFFFVATFTEDDLLTLHVWAGYTVGVFVVMRILWGFVGPRYARFSDLVYRPAKVRAYLVALAAFRAKRHLGHSPAGGAMAVALLVGLLATVWTGLELYAAEENAGPLAAVSAPGEVAPAARPRLLVRVGEDEDKGEERDEGRRGSRDGAGGEFWEGLHETLANLTLVLVVFHVGGVVLTSLAHRENLVRAMVTGRKRAED
ncbi:MAG: cytochrome b/b6 domain-containing protein [Kiloniellaceae bacterium]